MILIKEKKRTVNVMCTAFRDGFQSVFGARVLSKDYLPLIPEAVSAGLSHLEAGGGASFQAAFFYNNENAFDVMDAFRRAAGKDAVLQTLSRGVNVVALDSQSSEIIDLHARLFKKHGMSVIRNFDALNDPENLIFSARAIQHAGLKHELCVAMMSLPPNVSTTAHTPAFYLKILKKFLKNDIPFDSLCFKDASGTVTPHVVYETIHRARRLVGKTVPIVFHSHETAGTGLACYLAAVEAGADRVDLSLAPVSGGTCQPDVVSFWHALRGLPYELDCDVTAVLRLEEHLKEALRAYFIPPEAGRCDARIPFSPMPGGALTANTQMLRDLNLMDKYEEIIAAMPEVVLKGGLGTSVTPVSQFYFQQAFNNVTQGPWKQIAEGYGKMVLGYFGKTPEKPDPAVQKKAAVQLGLKPADKSVLEMNNLDPLKSRAYYEEELIQENLPVSDENVFITASCGRKGLDFLQGKGAVKVRYVADVAKNTSAEVKAVPDKTAGAAEGASGAAQTPAAGAAEGAVTQTVVVNGKAYHVELTGNQARVNGQVFEVSFEADSASQTAKESGAAPNSDAGASDKAEGVTGVEAGISGIVVEVAAVGDVIAPNGRVALVEAMKMQTPVVSVTGGRVTRVFVKPGDSVSPATRLCEVHHEK